MSKGILVYWRQERKTKSGHDVPNVGAGGKGGDYRDDEGDEEAGDADGGDHNVDDADDGDGA